MSSIRRFSSARRLRAADGRFVWNQAALRPMREAGEGPWLTPLMQGAFVTEQVYLQTNKVLAISLMWSGWKDTVRTFERETVSVASHRIWGSGALSCG